MAALSETDTLRSTENGSLSQALFPYEVVPAQNPIFALAVLAGAQHSIELLRQLGHRVIEEAAFILNNPIASGVPLPSLPDVLERHHRDPLLVTCVGLGALVGSFGGGYAAQYAYRERGPVVRSAAAVIGAGLGGIITPIVAGACALMFTS